jgi:hypothetical protein
MGLRKDRFKALGSTLNSGSKYHHENEIETVWGKDSGD